MHIEIIDDSRAEVLTNNQAVRCYFRFGRSKTERVHPATLVQEFGMTIANPSPLDIALMVRSRNKRRFEEDIAWTEYLGPAETPSITKIKPPKKLRKSKSKRRFLTKHEHAQLAHGELPTGVHWGEVKLTRRQKGMRKNARSIYARRLEKTFAVVAS